MSRTKKKKPSPGKEYWGKRPISRGCVSTGTRNKRDGIQKERAVNKRLVAKAVDEAWEKTNDRK